MRASRDARRTGNALGNVSPKCERALGCLAGLGTGRQKGTEGPFDKRPSVRSER